jgi:hypothetical protein
MADGKDGKYLTRILGMQGYQHTGGKPEDKMRRVLGTNAPLAAVQDVCADWIKVPGIPAIAKKKMRPLLEAWGTGPKSKIRITGPLENIREDKSASLLLQGSPPPASKSRFRFR